MRIPSLRSNFRVASSSSRSLRGNFRMMRLKISCLLLRGCRRVLVCPARCRGRTFLAVTMVMLQARKCVYSR